MSKSEIYQLLKLEARLELRNKAALGGILIYVASSVFVAYLSFRSAIGPHVWNAIFWIILLFASVNAAARSFIGMSRGRTLYLYTLAGPQAVILAKILYNSVLLLVVSMLTFLLFNFLIGRVVEDLPLFLVTLSLGSIGFSSLLTMVSAIASRTSNNFTLMAILSFPIMLPLLMVLMKLSRNAIDGLERWDLNSLAVLAFINVIIVALSYLLFRYLWRD